MHARASSCRNNASQRLPAIPSGGVLTLISPSVLHVFVHLLLQCYDGNPRFMQEEQTLLRASCAFRCHCIRRQSMTRAEETKRAASMMRVFQLQKNASHMQENKPCCERYVLSNVVVSDGNQ